MHKEVIIREINILCEVKYNVLANTDTLDLLFNHGYTQVLRFLFGLPKKYFEARLGCVKLLLASCESNL